MDTNKTMATQTKDTFETMSAARPKRPIFIKDQLLDSAQGRAGLQQQVPGIRAYKLQFRI